MSADAAKKNATAVSSAVASSDAEMLLRVTNPLRSITMAFSESDYTQFLAASFSTVVDDLMKKMTRIAHATAVVFTGTKERRELLGMQLICFSRQIGYPMVLSDNIIRVLVSQTECRVIYTVESLGLDTVLPEKKPLYIYMITSAAEPEILHYEDDDDDANVDDDDANDSDR